MSYTIYTRLDSLRVLYLGRRQTSLINDGIESLQGDHLGPLAISIDRYGSGGNTLFYPEPLNTNNGCGSFVKWGSCCKRASCMAYAARDVV